MTKSYGPKRCAHCGQPILVRCGIKMRPKAIEIFDAIADATPRGGIMLEGLRSVIYPAVPHELADTRLKAHIWQLNELLAGADVRIGHERGGVYCIVTNDHEAAKLRIIHKWRRAGSRAAGITLAKVSVPE